VECWHTVWATLHHERRPHMAIRARGQMGQLNLPYTAYVAPRGQHLLPIWRSGWDCSTSSVDRRCHDMGQTTSGKHLQHRTTETYSPIPQVLVFRPWLCWEVP
jgi:hypothetical protein